MNADIFQETTLLYNSEFNKLLGFIIHCHGLMLDKYRGSKIENNENKIRNRLYKDFLNSDLIKSKYDIFPHKIECESAEINADYHEIGYSDFKVLTATSFKISDAYFIIECKRLDGENHLDREYIKEGICRFVSGKYPSYYSTNGMIAFVVKKVNTDKNVANINNLILNDFPESNCLQSLTKIKNNITPKSYTSLHSSEDYSSITLHHVMLDYSEII